MPTRPRSRRVAVTALGLSSVLLASSSFALPVYGGEPGDEGKGESRSSTASSATASVSEATTGTVAQLFCESGFDDVHSKPDMSLHGVTLTRAGALAVGFTRRRGSGADARRRPAAIYNPADAWRRVLPRSPGREDGLVAVTAGPRSEAWAVGFTTIGGKVMPLAMRWNGKGWRVNRPAPRGPMPSMFTDVTTLGSGDPLAVGYRMTASGKRLPIVARKIGRRWTYMSPGVGRRESVSLTGVSPDRDGGLWVVGHGGPGAEIGPVIYRRGDGRWKRVSTPDLAGEAVLADVVATADDDAWAVGYQRNRDRSMALVLRWDGRRWERVAPPTFDSADVVLTAASVAPSGGIWVVGAAWNADIRRHEAVAAWWDGQAWDEIASPMGGEELHDVVGSLDADGWAVGRAGRQARTTRVCTPSQTGIFGGSEPIQPASPGGPPEDLASGSIAQASTAEASTEPSADEGTTTAAADEPDVRQPSGPAERSGDRPDARRIGSGSQTLTRKNKASRKRAAKARRQRRPALKALPAPKVDRKIVARNVARQAGVGESVNTYGAVVADFDADGLDDLFIGRHGRPGRLVLNQGGSFVDAEDVAFPSIDRHGCTAADLDGSGLPDLFCAVGGKRGSGLKSNELWIDPAAGGSVDVAVPLGRGRHATFLSSETGDLDLVVTNSPTRVDGLPSIGRLYQPLATGRLVARARTGFASRLGSLALGRGDFDADGREDLLLVTGGPQSPSQEGTRLYRNTKRGLIDVTKRLGIGSIREVDAELVDLNRDGRLDLVQLSPTRLRVSVLDGGRYRKVYERRLSHGRALATGDVDGDGRGDLYILRSNGARNSADVMLVNRGAGKRWISLRIPQLTSGDGDDAVAIDHDANGLDDFLVLNGRTQRGPIALIAFYER